jgi:hypothetical protein
MPHHLVPCHLSPLKNISEKSRSMPHHIMSCHLSYISITHYKSLISILSTCKNAKSSHDMPFSIQKYF